MVDQAKLEDIKDKKRDIMQDVANIKAWLNYLEADLKTLEEYEKDL